MSVKSKDKGSPECFVIMPISDSDGRDKGHFQRVFDCVHAPAIRAAGFDPTRADHVKETNLIHLDILRRLLEAPMVLCDLSDRNPNVLFELGLRQAFDKPVVLVQEAGTERIFDISGLRAIDYDSNLRVDLVQNAQSKIEAALKATYSADDSKEGANSIVRLLAISESAEQKLKDAKVDDPLLQRILIELNEMRRSLDSIQGRRLVGTFFPNEKGLASGVALEKRMEAWDQEFDELQVLAANGHDVRNMARILREDALVLARQSRNTAPMLSREFFGRFQQNLSLLDDLIKASEVPGEIGVGKGGQNRADRNSRRA